MEVKYCITIETTDDCNMDSKDIESQITEEILAILRFYNVKLTSLEIK